MLLSGNDAIEKPVFTRDRLWNSLYTYQLIMWRCVSNDA